MYDMACEYFVLFSGSRELSWFRIPTGLVDVSIDK